MFNLAYVDEMTGLHNLHWMEQNAARIISENKQKKLLLFLWILTGSILLMNTTEEKRAT